MASLSRTQWYTSPMATATRQQRLPHCNYSRWRPGNNYSRWNLANNSIYRSKLLMPHFFSTSTFLAWTSGLAARALILAASLLLQLLLTLRTLQGQRYALKDCRCCSLPQLSHARVWWWMTDDEASTNGLVEHPFFLTRQPMKFTLFAFQIKSSWLLLGIVIDWHVVWTF
jgi:hypothetical protein